MAQADPSMDRISSLPRDVTDSILEHLTIREAVRTSILSRKWRNKWKTVSKIRFDFNYTDANKLESVIYRILLHHSSRIRKCHLSMSSNLSRVPDIVPVIYHLSIHGIKDLSVFNDAGSYKLILPSYFFSCLELTDLDLRGTLFRPPPEFSGFNCLVSLQCHETQFKEVKFESFLPSCLLLEKLTLKSCTGVDNLVIDAPNLKYLSIDNCRDIKLICFKNTQNLATANILMYSSLRNTEQNQMMTSFISAFPKIEKLILGDYGDSYFKLLASGGVPLCVPDSLSLLKFLELESISFFNYYQISCVLCLIRSCPNLQELHIRGDVSFDGDMSSVTRYLALALTSHTSLDQLETVSINSLRGARPELEIIKFLLSCSPKLKTLNIGFYLFVTADVFMGASVELLSFQRASSEAKVIVDKPLCCQYYMAS